MVKDSKLSFLVKKKTHANYNISISVQQRKMLEANQDTCNSIIQSKLANTEIEGMAREESLRPYSKEGLFQHNQEHEYQRNVSQVEKGGGLEGGGNQFYAQKAIAECNFKSTRKGPLRNMIQMVEQVSEGVHRMHD